MPVGSTLRELWLDLRESLGFKRVYGYICVPADNMERAVEWYCRMFRIVRVIRMISPPSPGRVELGWKSGEGDDHALVGLEEASTWTTNGLQKERPILYSKRLKKVYNDCISKGARVSTIQRDSGGNHFFKLEDSEGNWIEICLEPGEQLA